jgi:hypothetical protein
VADGLMSRNHRIVGFEQKPQAVALASQTLR